MRNSTSFTENLTAERYAARAADMEVPSYPRQSFRHPRTSLGVAGHWVNLIGVLSPLVIGELIPDPTARWRAIRLSSVGTALLSEAIWTHHVLKKRHQEEEACNQR
jgi:hypothetical protein